MVTHEHTEKGISALFIANPSLDSTTRPREKAKAVQQLHCRVAKWLYEQWCREIHNRITRSIRVRNAGGVHHRARGGSEAEVEREKDVDHVEAVIIDYHGSEGGSIGRVVEHKCDAGRWISSRAQVPSPVRDAASGGHQLQAVCISIYLWRANRAWEGGARNAEVVGSGDCGAPGSCEGDGGSAGFVVEGGSVGCLCGWVSAIGGVRDQKIKAALNSAGRKHVVKQFKID